MKSSEIIREAKNYLQHPNNANTYYVSPFICDALQQVVEVKCMDGNFNYSKLQKKVDKIRNIIAERIYRRFSLRNWLIDQGVPSSEITTERLQKHRLQWMDMLISEFQSKGD